MDNKRRFDLIGKCLDRYEKLVNMETKLNSGEKNYGIEIERICMFMDLEFSNVNLEKLIAFDDFNFIHDMNGIFQNMNRETKKLNGFVPRAGIV